MSFLSMIEFCSDTPFCIKSSITYIHVLFVGKVVRSSKTARDKNTETKIPAATFMCFSRQPGKNGGSMTRVEGLTGKDTGSNVAESTQTSRGLTLFGFLWLPRRPESILYIL